MSKKLLYVNGRVGEQVVDSDIRLDSLNSGEFVAIETVRVPAHYVVRLTDGNRSTKDALQIRLRTQATLWWTY
jgi:hypothetical protein